METNEIIIQAQDKAIFFHHFVFLGICPTQRSCQPIALSVVMGTNWIELTAREQKAPKQVFQLAEVQKLGKKENQTNLDS